jgi:hypothetical protein
MVWPGGCRQAPQIGGVFEITARLRLGGQEEQYVLGINILQQDDEEIIHRVADMNDTTSFAVEDDRELSDHLSDITI